MVQLPSAGGNADAAIQVEQATEALAKTRNVDILCGYVLNSLQREQYHIYERSVQNTQPVVPSDGLSSA